MAIIGLACIVATGCGYTKEYAPIRIQPFSPRQPNQQRLVAQATVVAVQQAAAGAALQRYSGRTARVEVDGVFPHSDTDLLNYVGSVVAGEAARVGIRVLPPKDDDKDKVVVYGGRAGKPVPDEEPEAEIRLVASVDWGGIDLVERRHTNGWPLAGWIILPILGPLIGASLADDGFEELGIPLIYGSVLGDVAWIIFGDTTGHTFTMLGRTRVTLRAIPQVSGLAAAFGVGEGESSIVIDTDSDSGYALTVDLPKE